MHAHLILGIGRGSHYTSAQKKKKISQNFNKVLKAKSELVCKFGIVAGPDTRVHSTPLQTILSDPYWCWWERLREVKRPKRTLVGGAGMCRMISSCWRRGTEHVPVGFTRHLSPIKQKPKQARQWQQTLWSQSKGKDTLLLGRRRSHIHCPWGRETKPSYFQNTGKDSTTGEGETKSPPTLECGSCWGKKQKTPNKTKKDTKSSLTAMRRRGKDYEEAPPMRIRQSRPSWD